MSKDMLGQVVRKLAKIPLKMLGIICDLLAKLLGTEGEIWYEALGRFLRKENPWEAVKKAVKLLLELLGTVTLAASTEKFVAKDKFKKDTSDNATVKISSISDNFTEFFLSGEGKIEEPMAKTTINYYKLKKNSVDGPIIDELGGESAAETTLGEMFALMAMQPRGEKGVLLTNGKANIFYICDTKGVLRAVRVRWYGSGWSVHADSVESPGRWNEGNQVFSRNSKLSKL